MTDLDEMGRAMLSIMRPPPPLLPVLAEAVEAEPEVAPPGGGAEEETEVEEAEGSWDEGITEGTTMVSAAVYPELETVGMAAGADDSEGSTSMMLYKTVLISY